MKEPEPRHFANLGEMLDVVWPELKEAAENGTLEDEEIFGPVKDDTDNTRKDVEIDTVDSS